MHFISYLLTFQTILAGPNAFFEDYMAYLDGSNFPKILPKEVNYNKKYHLNGENILTICLLFIFIVPINIFCDVNIFCFRQNHHHHL